MFKPRKRPMKKLESQKQRSVSFTKRRNGLFNKAAELFMLCDAQLAVLVASPCSKPKRKVYSFGHPSADVVLDAFLNNCAPVPVDNGARQSALSLLGEIKGLESEINSLSQRNARLTNVGDGFSSAFQYFENSKSIEELQAVVDVLEKLIVEAKSRVSNSISWVPSNENGNGFCTLNQPDNGFCFTNNNIPSTSKSFGDDLSMFQDSASGYNYDSNSVLPVDNKEKNLLVVPGSSHSCFNYNDKGKEKLADCNMIRDPVTSYFGCLNDYGIVGETSNSRLDENWSLTNCSTSHNSSCSLSDMTANYVYNQAPLDFSGAVGTLDTTLQDLAAAADDVYGDSAFLDDLWSYQ
ncbi:mads box protein, putative [Ricinus communis]|uniref:Mads box protein, putative n=2 Tax=Ricinus communis TaxID=3988 RepID=B9T1Q7_RICCO|nr:mads box protein, putative [Ricinus communis]|eukprot:XP_002532176.1 agamous-like MADS-box protein AGL62 [Ricinus communis]